MDRTSRILLRKIIIDLVCLCLVGFSVLAFYLFGKPYHRGFFCDDDSINHPFKPSTVTSPMLYAVGILFPICAMLVGEYFYARNSNGQSSVVLFGKVIPPWVSLAYNKIGLFGFGSMASQVMTDIAKYTIGRLRPHFMDVCKPNIDCTLPQYQHMYITDFTCTASNSTARMLKESRLSFPSGHSSFSAYAMVYLALYLQLRVTWKGSKLLKNVLQLICLMVAWFTAMSRVSDYKHHWSDVLAGLLLGIIAALIMVFAVADLFKERRVPSSSIGTAHSEKLTTLDYDVEPGMQTLFPLTSPISGTTTPSPTNK
ncbi:putative phosphatidate phosphatase [Fopius arisanus]|uniref:Phosphatidate phosphatase n=1 Tax=Fopius arisanus TaxID=64838 RepID=A0A9R1TRQ6_9HYME|nr:PREDICTED: putative phosphatidate phosphatase [Fopius arisanus]